MLPNHFSSLFHIFSRFSFTFYSVIRYQGANFLNCVTLSCCSFGKVKNADGEKVWCDVQPVGRWLCRWIAGNSVRPLDNHCLPTRHGPSRKESAVNLSTLVITFS